MASRNRAPKQLWALMGTVFVDMVGALIVMPLLPYYAVEFQADALMVGLLTSIFAAAQTLSAPFWGWLSDRYGRRPIILIGLCASAVAYIFFGLAQSLWMLFVTRLMQGFGAGTIGVVQAYVADSVSPAERAKAFGWLTAAASAGVTVGPMIGSFLHPLGSEVPGLFAALLCLINVVLAWYVLPESSSRQQQAQRRSPLRAATDVLRHPRHPVSSLIWVYTLAMMAFLALGAMLGLYLMERFGVTETEIGFFYTFLGFVSLLMRAVVLGPAVDALGERGAMRLGALSMSVGFLLMPLASSVTLTVLVMVLVPIGTALLFPASTSMLSQRSVQAEVGQTLGVQQSFRGVAGVISPAVAGWIYKVFSDLCAGTTYSQLGLGAPFFFSGVLMLLVAVCTLYIRDPQKEAPPPEAELAELTSVGEAASEVGGGP